MADYAELDEAQLSGFHRKLLKEKGGADQKTFLDAAKDSEAFVEYFRENVPVGDGEPIQKFTGPLTEQSFKEMPANLEEIAYGLWSDVPPRIACRISFWGEVTLRHIEDGPIRESSWLAMNGGTAETGEERIDLALGESNDDRRNRLIDDCVRTVIRRMSGLPMARGRRSVFINPSFGRAWWRERIVNRITQREGTRDRSALLDTVRMNQQYWENLVIMMVSQGSVYGSSVVQDAFINSLAGIIQDEINTPIRNASTARQAMRRFSNIAASREVGALEFDEISEIVDELLLTIHNQAVDAG